MYKHHFYSNTCINNIQINNQIEIATNNKKGEFKSRDRKINGEITTKIEFIPKLNESDRQINEIWDKLSSFDQNRLIEKGVIKKGDIKKNIVYEVKYNF